MSYGVVRSTGCTIAPPPAIVLMAFPASLVLFSYLRAHCGEALVVL